MATRKFEVAVNCKGLSPNQLLLEMAEAPEIVDGFSISINRINVSIHDQVIQIGYIPPEIYAEIKSMKLRVLSWEIVLPLFQENTVPTKSWQLIEPIKFFIELNITEYGSRREQATSVELNKPANEGVFDAF